MIQGPWLGRQTAVVLRVCSSTRAMGVLEGCVLQFIRGRELIVRRSGSQRPRCVVRVPMSRTKGGRMGNVLLTELLSILLHEIVSRTRCRRVVVVWKAHHTTGSWRIHWSGIGEGRAAWFMDWGHCSGVGGVENMVIQDAVDVAVKGRLPGVGRRHLGWGIVCQTGHDMSTRRLCQNRR